MKKFILMAGILLCGIAQAQISVTGNNGQPITEGYNYTTSSLSLPDVQLGLHVTNTSEAPVNLKLKITSMENFGNQWVQFCFGSQCFDGITVGKTVPTNMGVAGYTFQPGENNGDNNHFYIGAAGTNPSENVVIGLAFIQLDNTGAQIGEPLVNFTYTYAPTASATDFNALQNMGITLKNTVVNSQLELVASQNATMELYNMAGQLVRTVNITQGSQSADLSSLSAAVYIARFTNEENKASQIRIVKN